MRIAQLAPLAESVPPKGYGGSEQVVSDLTEELVKLGHDVTLFATEDSETAARLVACTPTGLRPSNIAASRWAAYDIKTLLKLEEMKDQFDIIHNHMGYSALPALKRMGVPVVTTLHNPVKEYCADIFFHFADMAYVSISDAYKSLNYPSELNYVATVYNGINLDAFHVDKNAPRKNLLFVGRLCHDKGTLPAIQIARKLDMPIILAGKVDANDRPYFEKEIEPLIDGDKVKYIGEVSGTQKADLYSQAMATLCPIAFEEPFGLVLAESLASGTPVMAFSRGAVPEVISDGETGIVGKTVDELVSRFGEIKTMTSEVCRKRVEKLFSKESMAEKYIDVYQKILAGSRPRGQKQSQDMQELRR